MELIHNIGTLYTCDDHERILRNAWIIIDKGLIQDLGEGAPPEGDYSARHDLNGAVTMPGFVNIHHHFFQTLTRAVPALLRGHLIEWLYRCYPIWSGMLPEDLYAASQASLAQLALTGATTSVDHSYILPRNDPAYAESQIEAAQSLGMRLTLMRGSLTSLEADLETRLSAILGPKAGGLLDAPHDVVKDMARMMAHHHDQSHGAMLQIGFAPTTTTYDTPDFMRKVADLAQETKALMHLHFHPRPDERALGAASGFDPLHFLDQQGWLNERTFFAHATRLTKDEMALCADRGVSVAHCPRMILRLGARVTPIHDMISVGMKIGIGVDGGASNDSGSMLGELRVAQLLHRLAGGEGNVPWSDWFSPYKLLLMATREAAAIIGRDDIGAIRPGMAADIAAFELRGVAYSGAMTDPLSALFLTGDDDRASFVMAAGRILVRNRKLLISDEDRIAEKVNQSTARLLTRAAKLTGIDYNLYN